MVSCAPMWGRELSTVELFKRDLDTDDRADLVLFLRSLTDHDFLSDPAISSPFPDTPPDPFFEIIEALFAKRCGCHQAASPAASLDLGPGRAYGSLVGVASSSTLPYVQPGIPDDSYLLHKVMGSHAVIVAGSGEQMPPPVADGSTWEPLSAQQLADVRAWIRRGALPAGE